ncbi:LmbU family transcriptional regulator [Streptomyces sp. CC228A]|uniref:LmbU family transcriptional regulator n=1 Tax=Streptomyces sp. CC228A TaxID=2898186 RepID=UPI001F1BCCC4|nr:LmbU family transcriptional regulator [Streptomyces sp. CC228A]
MATATPNALNEPRTISSGDENATPRLKGSSARRKVAMVTDVGLQLPGGMSFESWEKAGRNLARVASSSAWCLGDWIVYGQSRYEGRYRDAVESVGLDYQTVRNYAWVARRVPQSARRKELSFQHHAEVASLSPQEQESWLDRAVKERWSRNQLRGELRAARSTEPRPATTVSMPKLEVPEAQLARWRKAAELAGASLQGWIVNLLESEANSVLADTRAPSPDEVDAEVLPAIPTQKGRD